MQRAEFERLVEEALEKLPDEFKDKLGNVDVVIEDYPSKDLSGVGRDGLLLGLYQGIPLSKRTHYYAGALPDKISIFKRNVERICSSRKDIAKAIKRVIQHEIAHHFGISDERLRELGLY